MKTLFSVVFEAARLVKNGRNKLDVYAHMGSEFRELGLEIVGRGDGKDGVIGESIDIIACAIDQIFVENPDITEADLIPVMERKCEKWKAVYKDRPGKIDAPGLGTVSSDAHDLWVLGQLLPGGDIKAAVAKIEAFLIDRDSRIHSNKMEALQNVLGLLDTPIGRRRHANDKFYDEVVQSVRDAV